MTNKKSHHKMAFNSIELINFILCYQETLIKTETLV